MSYLMKLNIILVMLSLFLLPIKVNCQNKINSQEYISIDSTINRDLYASINTGIFEWFGIGIGYQLSKEFAIELKHASTWLSGHSSAFFTPPCGSGVGFEANYFSDMGIFNNISISYIYLLYVPNIYTKSYGIKPKGNCFEINTGNEKIQLGTERKLNFFWSIGIGISTNKAYNKTLIMPSLKSGLLTT